jgi:tRNA uridine 5-carboxymethylaminomethyl modification enzyme
LEPKGRNVGLVGDDEWRRFNQRRDRLAIARQLLITIRIRRSDAAYSEFAQITGQDLGDSITLGQLALRPNIAPSHILNLLLPSQRAQIEARDLETVIADHLYAGYLETQNQTSRRLRQHDSLAIPTTLSFKSVSSLSHEMVERLERVRPQSFGQARKIPGLTPAALSNLLVHLTAAQQV